MPTDNVVSSIFSIGTVREKIRKPETVALHDLPWADADHRIKDRGRIAKSVEFTEFATTVNAAGQL